MTWGNIKIDPADKVFSIFIRLRDKKCKRCGRPGVMSADNLPILGLENSHFYSRGAESVRFDPENCDAMCAGCHRYFGSNPADYAAWKLRKLGQQGYDLLAIRKHNTSGRRDRKMALIVSRVLLKEEKERFELSTDTEDW